MNNCFIKTLFFVTKAYVQTFKSSKKTSNKETKTQLCTRNDMKNTSFITRKQSERGYLGLEFLDHVLALQVPDLDGGAGSGAQPVPDTGYK